MESYQEWLLTLVALAILFTLLSLGMKRRREALSDVARELGFSFEPQAHSLQDAGFSDFPLFHRSYTKMKGASNAMKGQLGATAVVLFDYHLHLGFRRSFQQTVAAIHANQSVFPDFELKPVSIFFPDILHPAYKDIGLEANPKFPKGYRLRGSNEAAVRNFFRGRLVKFFESRENFCMEGGGAWLVVYRLGKQVKPKEIRRFLEEARRVFTLLS